MKEERDRERYGCVWCHLIGSTRWSDVNFKKQKRARTKNTSCDSIRRAYTRASHEYVRQSSCGKQYFSLELDHRVEQEERLRSHREIISYIEPFTAVGTKYNLP